MKNQVEMLQEKQTEPATHHEAELDGSPITLDEYNRFVNLAATLPSRLSEPIRKKISASVEVVDNAVASGQVVYGITTGFGGMSDVRIPTECTAGLQSNLLNFLAAGAGPEIDRNHTRGAMLLRANVLLQGKSGVRAEIIERLLEFVSRDAVPVVRELGSIGASGDLVPLSTIARATTGQGAKALVRIGGQRMTSAEALKSLDLQPIELRAKEGLALVNGTSFSAAIATNTALAARRALSISLVIQSMLMEALDVDLDPFESFVHKSKPHPGQIWTAEILRGLVHRERPQKANNGEVQDRYSLRCFPQYTGAIVEGMARVESVVETEMNSVSDNPLIDVHSGRFYQSGNFLGQYIGMAMDDTRRHLALLAKHLDVQLASLVTPEFSKGLSPSLRGNDDRHHNMGLKGLQICINSIVPLLAHSANPMVEHFPTHAEQFNQNINGLSWGASLKAWESIQLFQQVLGVASLFAIQAVDLRAHLATGSYDGRVILGEQGQAYYQAVHELLDVPNSNARPYLFDDADRWLEQDVELLAADIANQGRLVETVGAVTDSFLAFRRSQS